MNPIISIVTPVYNRQHYLGAAIESVLKQTRHDFELLVWNDGSTDASLNIARYYAKLDKRVRVIAAEHQGIAPSVKAAFAATTGSYIGLIDSDDLLAPTALEDTVAILDAYPEVGMVYTDYQIIDTQGQEKGLGKRCHIPYSKNRLLVDFMTFHFRLLRRSIYEQVGGIDESFELAEDYDLCLKLSEVTVIQHLQKPLYYHRRHIGNITNHRPELIHWSYKAISQALKRRGLDNDYKLEVQDTGKFIIRHKEAAYEPVLSRH